MCVECSTKFRNWFSRVTPDQIVVISALVSQIYVEPDDGVKCGRCFITTFAQYSKE